MKDGEIHHIYPRNLGIKGPVKCIVSASFNEFGDKMRDTAAKRESRLGTRSYIPHFLEIQQKNEGPFPRSQIVFAGYLALLFRSEQFYNMSLLFAGWGYKGQHCLFPWSFSSSSFCCLLCFVFRFSTSSLDFHLDLLTERRDLMRPHVRFRSHLSPWLSFSRGPFFPIFLFSVLSAFFFNLK